MAIVSKARIMTSSYNSVPLIVILGSTGTGKSKLGIELAKKVNGEIISADSMQVYKDLDIITNKVTKQEQEQVKHHIIDIAELPHEFTVHQFQKTALKVISDLSKEKKLPIIVGGTNYYIESILWKYLITQDEKAKVNPSANLQKREEPISGRWTTRDNTALYEQLQKVDPERAEQLHPNDIRKISRSLQVLEQTGKKHSELLKEQKGITGSSHLSGPMQFEKTLIFWLRCKQDILNKRITDRVDKMLSMGLLEEITKFHKKFITNETEKRKDFGDIWSNEDDTYVNESKRLRLEGTHCKPLENFKKNETFEEKRNCIDRANKTDPSEYDGTEELSDNKTQVDLEFQDGQLQAIGLKEFYPYLLYKGDSEEEKEKILRNCVECLKNRTIRYSKKQQTWVRNRFLTRDNAPNIYELDVTNIQEWNKNVFEKSYLITKSFLENKEIPFSPVERDLEQCSVDKHKKYICEICDNKIIIGDNIWIIHLNSRIHKRRKTKINKLKNI